MKSVVFRAVAPLVLIGAAVCAHAAPPITEAEVIAAETAWADQLFTIGTDFTAGGDYKTEARKMVDDHYA